jgi:hypothetical protein
MTTLRPWLLDREDRQQVRHLGQVHGTAIARPCRPAATPRNGKRVLGVRSCVPVFSD